MTGADLVEEERFFSVETIAKEFTNQVAAEEIKVMDAVPTVLQQILQQPLRERYDDWFVLLDVAPRQTFVLPGIALLHLFFKATNSGLFFCLIDTIFTFLFISVAVSQRADVPVVDSISVVEMKTTQQKEKTIEAVMDDTKLEQVIFHPQTQRETEDVWFVLLDVPKRKSLFVPPGSVLLVITG